MSHSFVEVTKRVEWDMGHRIPSHASKCKNPHGHRFVIEATVRGPVHGVRGVTDDGMVLDFGDLKKALMEKIHDPLDHGFMVYEGDTELLAALKPFGKIISVPFIPTVENLASYAFTVLQCSIQAPMQLVRVRVYETPTGWADAQGSSSQE